MCVHACLSTQNSYQVRLHDESSLTHRPPLISTHWLDMNSTWNHLITRVCDLTHSAASGSVIRIRHGFTSMLQIFFIGWVQPSGVPDGWGFPSHHRTNRLSIRIKLNFKYLNPNRNNCRNLFATSIWFSPPVFGSILLQHESHLILREQPASSGANSESFMNTYKAGM